MNLNIDFAALYPIPTPAHDLTALGDLLEDHLDECVPCAEHYDMLLTPRNAFLLVSAARFIGEDAVAGVLDGERHSVGDYLPVYAHRQSLSFYERFRQVFLDIAARIERGEDCRPRSTAEELALAAIVAEVETQAEMALEWPEYAALPRHRNDGATAWLDDVLFADHDIRYEHDGELATARDLSDWFAPFDDALLEGLMDTFESEWTDEEVASVAMIEQAFEIDDELADAVIEYVDTHGGERRESAELGQAPFPAVDNPMFEFLFATTMARIKAGLSVEEMLLHAIVHAWFEGNIEGFEQATTRKDAS